MRRPRLVLALFLKSQVYFILGRPSDRKQGGYFRYAAKEIAFNCN